MPKTDPNQVTKIESMAKKPTGLPSTVKLLDIKGIRDGVIIQKDGSLRQIIMTSSINFALMSPDEQKNKVFAYQEFLNALEFPVQIVVQSKRLNIKEYLVKVKEAERMQENELLRMQIAEYAEYIASLVELANITTNHYYIVVPYTKPALEKKEGLLEKIKDILSPAKKAKEEEEAFSSMKEKLNLRVNAVLSALGGLGLQAAPLNTQETVELLYTWYNPEASAIQILAELEKLKIEQ